MVDFSCSAGGEPDGPRSHFTLDRRRGEGFPAPELGFALALSGRLDEAVEALETAVRLSPRDPILWGTMCFLSVAYNLLGNYEAAVEWGRKAVHEPRAAAGGYWSFAVLGSAPGNLVDTEAARSVIDEALQRKPDLSIAYLEKTLPTKHPGGLENYLNGLRKAGLPS